VKLLIYVSIWPSLQCSTNLKQQASYIFCRWLSFRNLCKMFCS